MCIRDRAYCLKSSGKAGLFPVVTHIFEKDKADLDIKSGELSGAGLFGLKLVSWFGDNVSKNLPALIGTILVFDSNTGAPIGLMNAGQITGMRTGAAAAIGSRCLARPDSHTLLLVGCGTQDVYKRQVLGATPKTYNKHDEALLAVKNGTIDGHVLDGSVGNTYADSMGGLKVIEIPE